MASPERKENPQYKEEAMFAAPHSQQQQSYGERHHYAKRPLEDLSLTELVQYARRYGIMGAAITKKDELLKKIRFAETS